MTTGDPKHRIIRDALLREIQSGALATGALVPPERELVTRFGASRLTVRYALDQLAAEGLISRHRGRGTFVCARPRARNGGSGRQVVGIVSAGLDQATAPLLRAAQTVLREHGRHNLLTDCDGHDLSFDLDRVRLLVDQNVQGLLIYPLSHLPALRVYQELVASGLPVVFVDSILSGIDADFVTSDNLAGAHQGTEALIAAGCRRIAFCSGWMAAWTSQERLAGCRKALWGHGFDLPGELIRTGSFAPSFGAETAHWLLDNQPEVDGWFFANHTHAEGALEVVRARCGKDRPAPRICAFDASPALSDDGILFASVAQPMAALGTMAAQLLLQRIDESDRGTAPASRQHVQLPVSCAIAPHSITSA